jgi:ABC-type lipoprotein release transport system permease subunit
MHHKPLLARRGQSCTAEEATMHDHVATYQTSAYNPLLLAMTISILGVVALVACLFPARRASLINPIDALRIE